MKQTNNHKRRYLYKQSGFSLIEILVALTLLAIAGTFVVGKIINYLEEGRVKSTRIQMSGFASQLKQFYRRCNFYPSTEQGLEALISEPSGGKKCTDYPKGGFLDNADNLPVDPWGSSYVYELKSRMKFIISSDGPDQESGTEDDLYFPPKKK